MSRQVSTESAATDIATTVPTMGSLPEFNEEADDLFDERPSMTGGISRQLSAPCSELGERLSYNTGFNGWSRQMSAPPAPICTWGRQVSVGACSDFDDSGSMAQGCFNRQESSQSMPGGFSMPVSGSVQQPATTTPQVAQTMVPQVFLQMAPCMNPQAQQQVIQVPVLLNVVTTPMNPIRMASIAQLNQMAPPSNNEAAFSEKMAQIEKLNELTNSAVSETKSVIEKLLRESMPDHYED
jgi:hypothetical protein